MANNAFVRYLVPAAGTRRHKAFVGQDKGQRHDS